MHSSAFPRVSDFVSTVAWRMMNDPLFGLCVDVAARWRAFMSGRVVCQAAGEGEAGVGSAEWARRDEGLPGASQEKEQCRFPAVSFWKRMTKQVVQSQACHTSSPILFLWDSKTSFKPHESIVRCRHFLLLLASAQKSLWVRIALAKCCITASSLLLFCLLLTVYGFWELVCACGGDAEHHKPSIFYIHLSFNIWVEDFFFCCTFWVQLWITSAVLLYLNTISEDERHGLWDICSRLAVGAWLR